MFSSLLVSLLLQWVFPVTSLNPACECIIFEANYGKDFGTFTSPNFPVSYETDINCLLYTFVGNENEIIQLTFDEFDVQKSDVGCETGDFLKLFLHLPRPQVNEFTRWDDVLCGTLLDIDKTYYSSGSTIIFEFHSDQRNGNNTGFRGTYHFEDKRLFQTEGEQITGTLCDYQFISVNKSMSKGRFYSPRYPSNYPPNTRCAYLFIGKLNEKVKLIFENVSLYHGDDSCLDLPDDIVVHDGRDSKAPVIGQLCHTSTMFEVISTGSILFVEFVSKSSNPRQGFKAIYSFEEDSGPGLSFGLPSTEPERSLNDKKVISKILPTPKALASCDQMFTSDVHKAGNFSSPGYPSHGYPSRIHCKYTFIGRGKERVQIIFTDFDLYMAKDPNNGSTKTCEGVDVVNVFVPINGVPERLDNFCGKTIPKQLMSNGPTMTLDFISYQASSTARGFRAMYRFVTNFGITAGKQKNETVCGFEFDSNETTNGTFTSPNFPGFYPRNTECHYFFYGKPKERVRVTFAYFDIEGITPCKMQSASDYVEFSNFPSADRKIPRHCGLRTPVPMVSERNFFRVTFRSNQRFDGTGFEAFYQFVNIDEGSTIMRVAPSKSTSIGQQMNNVIVIFSVFVILIFLQ